MPSESELRMRTSMPGSGLPTVSARNGFRSLTVTAAETWARMIFREGFVDGNERIEDFSFAWRQSVESRLQAFLQIFQDQRHETDVGDFVLWEGFADVFRTEGAEMHDG